MNDKEPCSEGDITETALKKFKALIFAGSANPIGVDDPIVDRLMDATRAERNKVVGYGSIRNWTWYSRMILPLAAVFVVLLGAGVFMFNGRQSSILVVYPQDMGGLNFVMRGGETNQQSASGQMLSSLLQIVETQYGAGRVTVTNLSADVINRFIPGIANGTGTTIPSELVTQRFVLFVTETTSPGDDSIVLMLYDTRERRIAGRQVIRAAANREEMIAVVRSLLQ